MLREAGQDPTNPAGLLDLLRRHQATPAQKRRFPDLVRDLGDTSFPVRERATRELLSAGPAALPFVRAAVRDKDLERRRRAQECVAYLERIGDPALTEVVLRVLLRVRPPGLTEALLAYLPAAEAEGLGLAVVRTLHACTPPGAKPSPAVLAALADAEPCRRAAAVTLLRPPLDGGMRRALRRLRTDAAPRVRLRAAEALLRAGDKTGVPVLVDLLGEAPLPVAWQAERLLTGIAGPAAPRVGLQGTAASRRQVRSAWQRWWKRHGDHCDPATRLREEKVPHVVLIVSVGYRLGMEMDGRETILALDADYQPIWQFDYGPNEIPKTIQLLPNGRVLVGEIYGPPAGGKRKEAVDLVGRVAERDRTGRIVWQVDQLSESILECWRQDDGRTCIYPCQEEDAFFEVNPEGKRVWSLKLPKEVVGVYTARPLPNGNIAILEAGELIILTRSGREVKRLTYDACVIDAGLRISLAILPNGHFLIGRNGCQREYDSRGVTVPVGDTDLGGEVVRLPNGHSVVARAGKLEEVDQAGKTVRTVILKCPYRKPIRVLPVPKGMPEPEGDGLPSHLVVAP